MMIRDFTWSRRLFVSGAVALFASIPIAGTAGAQSLQDVSAAPTSDGTMGAAAAAAFSRGALRASAADVAAEAAANRAYDRAAAAGALAPAGNAAAAGGASGPLAPTFVPGRNFNGQFDSFSTPPDTTGAIGPTRYIQLVNRRFAIHSRTSTIPLSSGTLQTLHGFTANHFDPQIIWDNTTQRFYYVGDGIINANNNTLAFGFSKTASPTNGTTDWCKYFLNYGRIFPDYPKLGDSANFLLIGVNNFAPSFLQSDLIAIRKPGAGTVCPAGSTILVQINMGLKDTSGNLCFTPVPANQIDTSTFGAGVCRSLTLPATRLTIHTVSQTGSPPIAVFNAPRNLTVASYTVPPDATQPTLSQRLDTLDARPTQAVLASNPIRGTFSLWTQHTINVGGVAGIRFYEINPLPLAPTLLRQANISASPAHLFNAAISPDRRTDGATAQFGGSFVIGYNVTRSVAPGINTRILTGSSVNGGALSFATVLTSSGPYRSFECATASSTCRWGDYSGASPDPRPLSAAATGVVGLTNQFNSGGTSTAQANWRTRIWEARP